MKNNNYEPVIWFFLYFALAHIFSNKMDSIIMLLCIILGYLIGIFNRLGKSN